MTVRVSFPAFCLCVLAVLLGACDQPVYFGSARARAAGYAIGADGRVAGRAAPSIPVSAAPGPNGEDRDPAAPSTPSSGVAPSRPAGQAASTPPAAAVLFLPRLPQPTEADDVVGVALQALDESRPRRPGTFGQVFEPGRLPRGQTIMARANKADLPTQLDIKTTNPDGSVRMGVVTVIAAAPADLMLRRTPASPGSAPAVELSAVAGQYDLTVTLDFKDGLAPGTRTIDIAATLADALRKGQVSYWLRGPLVTEGRIEVPIVSSLRLVADVRAHADGSVMTDLQFNNDIALRPVGGTLTYDVTIASRGKLLVHEPDVRHSQYQTWHQEVWSNGRPAVNVVHDTAALARAAAIQNYDLSTGVAAALVAHQTQSMHGPSFGVLGNANVTKYMGMTGGRADIGALTLPNTVWLLTQHPDAARYALAQADAAGSIPWHFYDSASRTHVAVTRHPALWADGRGGQSHGTTGLTQLADHEGSGWAPDDAHQPDLSYVPYILTGSRYRYDQLEAQATGTIVNLWPGPRQNGTALVTANEMQVRGRAWAFRVVDEAAFIAPDDAPLRPYFRLSQRNSIDYLLAQARARTMGEAYGHFLNPHYREDSGHTTPPWQQDFLASSLVMAARRQVEGAAELVRWMGNFLVGRFLAEDRGFHPNNAVVYQLVVWEKSINEPYLTWREIEAASLKFGYVKDGSVWAYNDGAYAQTARAVLAGIVTVTGSADARRAYDWMNRHAPAVDVTSWRRNPTWNIVP